MIEGKSTTRKSKNDTVSFPPKSSLLRPKSPLSLPLASLESFALDLAKGQYQWKMIRTPKR